MMALFHKFWLYQKIRFPLLILLSTTTAVVFSTAGAQGISATDNILSFIIAICTGVSLLLTIRILDDIRDFAHDNRFHKDRPIQARIITLHELSLINTVCIVATLIVLFFTGLVPFFYGVFKYIFVYFAGKDFYLGQRLKQYFLVYNSVNFIQMLWLQLLLYAIIHPTFTLVSTVAWVHFAFAIVNAAIIEVVRKIPPPTYESEGKDTYSWRFGFTGALWLYLFTCICTVALYIWCALLVNDSAYLAMYIATFLLVSIVLTISIYNKIRTKIMNIILEITAIFVYIFLHVSLYFI